MSYGIIVYCQNGESWIIKSVGEKYLEEVAGNYIEFKFRTKKQLIFAAEKINKLSIKLFMVLTKTQCKETFVIRL